MTDDSLAVDQHPVGDPNRTYPLTPALTAGDPATTDPADQRPLEVGYDYEAVGPGLFAGAIRPGIERRAPLLPPLAGDGLGEGARRGCRTDGGFGFVRRTRPHRLGAVQLPTSTNCSTTSSPRSTTCLTCSTIVAESTASTKSLLAPLHTRVWLESRLWTSTT